MANHRAIIKINAKSRKEADWMVKYADPREWTEYPPENVRTRHEEYETYRNLLMGRHKDVFCNNTKNIHHKRSETALMHDAAALYDDGDLYVSANYCKMASQIFANILFGTPPKYRIEAEGAGIDAIQQQRIDQIAIDNMLSVTNHQQEVEASHLGGAVYRLRWGKMNNWRTDGVIIEALPVDVYEPILSPDNIKDNQGGVLSFPFEYNGANYLYREIYEPGKISYMLNEMMGNSIGAQIPLESVPFYAHITDAAKAGNDNYHMDGNTVIFETDYPGMFIEYVPNWTKPDLYFGISDYSPDVISNQCAINAIKTGILRVCLKHMDPKLALPEGLMTQDPMTGKWYIQKEDMEAIEVPDAVASALPRYVTWDAKLDAAQLNIDACFEAMMMSMQISPAVFGWEKYGQADSAAALKLRMTLTLWMVSQKRTYFDAALKNILYAAQYLDGRYGAAKYEPMEVSITWPDPLPVDESTEASALKTMLGSKLISVETAVSRIQGIEGEALENELNLIAKDNRAQQIVELGQLAAYQAISPDAMLRIYRGENIEDVLRSAKAPIAEN
ncbi:phage portal protein [Eubacteriales bacterium OttesenSCG-928-K08]|nr:phage portal protein [Eubacteriales bacterium OttesenSCG-928-K08]